MEEYRNPDHVEFITNMDGTISVLIKNIGMLSSSISHKIYLSADSNDCDT